MHKTAKLYVAHIETEIRFLQEIADTFTFEQFAKDESHFRAAIYSVQIISEAIRKLPSEWLADYETINWAMVRGIGNITRHEYFRVDKEIIWQVIVDHIQHLHLAMLDFQERDEV